MEHGRVVGPQRPCVDRLGLRKFLDRPLISRPEHEQAADLVHRAQPRRLILGVGQEHPLGIVDERGRLCSAEAHPEVGQREALDRGLGVVRPEPFDEDVERAVAQRHGTIAVATSE